MIFVEFLALARGKAAAAISLMTTSFVPLMAVSSLDLAYALVHDLIVGSILALLLIFLVHALFPERSEPQQSVAQTVRESAPLGAALANTGVLMSLFVYFMGTGTPTSIIVIMVTAVTILQQSAVAGPGAALAPGLIVGNVAGGLAATIAYLLVSLLPTPAFLFLTVLLLGLVFGAKIASRRQARACLSGRGGNIPDGARSRAVSSAPGQRRDLSGSDIDGYSCLALHNRRCGRFARAVRWQRFNSRDRFHSPTSMT